MRRLEPENCPKEPVGGALDPVLCTSRWSLEACLQQGQHAVFEAAARTAVTFDLYGERDGRMVRFTSARGGGVGEEGSDTFEPTLLPFVAPRSSDPGGLAGEDWCYRLDVSAPGFLESVELRTVGAAARFDEPSVGFFLP